MVQSQWSFLTKLLQSAKTRDRAIEPDQFERQLRELMAAERARIEKGPGPTTGKQAAARRRYANDRARKILRSVRGQRSHELPKEVLIARRRESPILRAIYPQRDTEWVPILRRPVLEQPPAITLKNFSFLDDPNGTISALKEIAGLEASVVQAYLHFEDEYCLDAGSYLVLAEIFPQMAQVFHGGRMTVPIQKVLSATGVGRHSKMKLRGAEREMMEEYWDPTVWAFPLQRRRAARSSRSASVHLDPQTREEASDRFCDAVDKWLGVDDIGMELTASGRGWIGGIIGELLCNAERHSQADSDDGDWAATGFMVRRDGQLLCNMAFLSVGRSFAESLEDAAPEIREFIDKYTKRHWACGLSAEALTTVVALQDTITCDPEARQSGSGGTGLQDVLEFVAALAGPKASEVSTRVVIVSGKSCIRLRYPYLFGLRAAEGKPRILWCNGLNSSKAPPEHGIVTMLQDHFAGTLVSVAFTLDPDYLTKHTESKSDGDDKS